MFTELFKAVALCFFRLSRSHFHEDECGKIPNFVPIGPGTIDLETLCARAKNTMREYDVNLIDEVKLGG
jgi:hypothetical protein